MIGTRRDVLLSVLEHTPRLGLLVPLVGIAAVVMMMAMPAVPIVVRPVLLISRVHVNSKAVCF